MMFAIGCIQAMKCHTNHCPTGVTTQDKARARALDVPDKITRVYNFQRATVASAAQIVASMGLDNFAELSPAMLNRRIESQRTRTYAEIYDWLMPAELLQDAPQSWRTDWAAAPPTNSASSAPLVSTQNYERCARTPGVGPARWRPLLLARRRSHAA
jgi:hypothetical protein